MKQVALIWRSFWFGVIVGVGFMRIRAGGPYSDNPTFIWAIACPFLLSAPEWIAWLARKCRARPTQTA